MIDQFLSAEFLISLAVTSVLSGLLLFIISRFVGAKGGLLAAIGVAFLVTVINVVALESFVFPLIDSSIDQKLANMEAELQRDPADFVIGLLTAGLIMLILPGVVWVVTVMALMKVSFFKAILIAVIERILVFILGLIGFLAFLVAFL